MKLVSVMEAFCYDEYIQNGAESEEELRVRANLAVKRIIDMGLDSILVVGHNSFGKYFISAVRGSSPKEIEKLPNTHVFKILS